MLGLAQALLAVAPATAYLMIGGRCLLDCAFCAQGRHSQASALNLSRVTWPEYDLGLVVTRLAEAARQGAFRRVCLQVTVTLDAMERSLAVLRRLKAVSSTPVDIAILPRTLEQVRRLMDAGADHIGFGLDAACERVFVQVKGGNWGRSLNLLEETARSFPQRAVVHLIVGLGETEQEIIERIQWAHDRGITVGLFAFTPLRGTSLADRSPPPLAVYRRIQAARWLIVHGRAQAQQMAFDTAGRLIDYGAFLPLTGEPFQTSGCPDCNRPFYNELPGGPWYNYPRPLTAEEIVQARCEMGLDSGFYPSGG
ncbi:MAG: radical SAM protein [Anaerolineae bacterium]